MVPRGATASTASALCLASGEVARALHRVHGDIGLEGRAWTPEALAARGLGRLALARLADHHHGVHIHARKRGKHGVECGAAAIHAVAAPDPVEGGKGRALAHAAERVDELRVCGARGGHGASEGNVPFVRLGAGLRGDRVKRSQRT